MTTYIKITEIRKLYEPRPTYLSKLVVPYHFFSLFLSTSFFFVFQFSKLILSTYTKYLTICNILSHDVLFFFIFIIVDFWLIFSLFCLFSLSLTFISLTVSGKAFIVLSEWNQSKIIQLPQSNENQYFGDFSIKLSIILDKVKWTWFLID